MAGERRVRFGGSVERALEIARERDANDPLKGYRSEFVVDDPELIYLDGNSLGRLPKRTLALTENLVRRQWGGRLVRGWGDGWIDLPKRLGRKIAGLIGARPEEVIVCDSTSVNLYKLIEAAVELQAGRSVILTDDSNFPSDVYLASGIARRRQMGFKVTSPDEVAELLDQRTALMTLSHVAFKSGAIQPMQELTREAHRHGALALWDLSHSVGALPIDLNGCDVDLAVGCTYKYLNAGPGAPAFLYVRKDLQERLVSPIWGWFSQENAFGFDLDYRPRSDVGRFLAGTPPILSMSAIEVGVDLVHEAGLSRLRAKSVSQSDFLIDLWEEFLKPLGVSLASPRNSEQRGSHVSFSHPEGFQIDQALIEEMNVIPDFRHPDNIRFGITPLYTTYEELVRAVTSFKVVLESGSYSKYSPKSDTVT